MGQHRSGSRLQRHPDLQSTRAKLDSMADGNQLLAEALAQPKDAMFAHLSQALENAYPDRAILETEDNAFDVHSFAHEGKCQWRPKPNVHQQWDRHWDGYHGRIAGRIFNTWHEVQWEGHELELVSIGQLQNHCRELRHYLIAKDDAIARSFFEAVCRFCSEVRGEILVFSEGHWSKSADLFESIRQTTLETLILAESLKESILADFQQFFECKETYTKHGIPWKRGVLFLGPPGNGKTHAIKGLTNALGKPCLYVRSFSAEYGSDHQCISAAFAKARESAPCLFILEDLDSLVTDQNRAYFLNELDGFYSNEGLLTVATTNHPERLDPAILDRPSRFDRKYTFDLPEAVDRKRYLAAFSSRLEPELRLTEGGIEQIAGLTDEFSFAYLKELFLSSMMAWISDHEHTSMDKVMATQTTTLRDQMKTATEVPEQFNLDEDDVPAYVPAQYRAMYRRMVGRRRR